LVLARNLDTAEYGLFYAGFSLLFSVTLFKHLGLGAALIKYIAEHKAREKIFPANAMKSMLDRPWDAQYNARVTYLMGS